MVDIARGKAPMQYPGAPSLVPGEQYSPNETEKEFIRQSRGVLYKRLFQYTFIMGGLPYLIVTARNRINPATLNNRWMRPRFWGLIGGKSTLLYNII